MNLWIGLIAGAVGVAYCWLCLPTPIISDNERMILIPLCILESAVLGFSFFSYWYMRYNGSVLQALVINKLALVAGVLLFVARIYFIPEMHTEDAIKNNWVGIGVEFVFWIPLMIQFFGNRSRRNQTTNREEEFKTLED